MPSKGYGCAVTDAAGGTYEYVSKESAPENTSRMSKQRVCRDPSSCIMSVVAYSSRQSGGAKIYKILGSVLFRLMYVPDLWHRMSGQ